MVIANDEPPGVASLKTKAHTLLCADGKGAGFISRTGGTKDALLKQCDQYHVPHIEYGTKDTLGRITGYGECACCAVTDEGLAESIKGLFGSRKEERKPHGENEDQ